MTVHAYIGTKLITATPEMRGSNTGYSVVYEDGYRSWSPTEAFEKAYRVAEGDAQKLTFGDAIYFLKLGRKVARSGWNGKGLWLEMQVPDAHSKMTLPYIYICYPADSANTPGARVPWLASQTDMLTEDWCVLP